jgi:hypothetical protein
MPANVQLIYERAAHMRFVAMQMGMVLAVRF